MGLVIELAELHLADATGSEVRLGDLIDRPTIIDLVRYYGCAPCRAYLRGLADRHQEITDRGGAVLGIGPSAPYQARLLAEKADIPFPLLLDPKHLVGTTVGLHRQSLARFVFDLRAWGRWAAGFLRSGQGRITGSYWETPGVLVTDAAARVRWAHRGRAIGDYPDLERVVGEMDRILATGPSGTI